MANLLPQEYKDTVRRDRHSRVVIVVCWGILLLAVLGILFLLPSLFISMANAHGAEQQVELTRKFVKQQEEGGVLGEIRQVRNRIERLEREFKDVKLSEIIDVVNTDLPVGITLLNISYIRAADAPDSVTLNGIADTREELLSFTRALDREKLFAGVDLPISNLAQSVDISFSLTFDVLGHTDVPESSESLDTGDIQESDGIETRT